MNEKKKIVRFHVRSIPIISLPYRLFTIVSRQINRKEKRASSVCDCNERLSSDDSRRETKKGKRKENGKKGKEKDKKQNQKKNTERVRKSL